MFTIYNTTLVAVMQIGVIVVGVLASGLWHRFSTVNNMAMPFPAGLLYSYGMIGFVIPFAWLTCALLLRRSPVISDDMKGLAFGFGIIVLVGLVVFVLYANVSPVFGIMWNLRGDDDA
jgi:hypothetical protein